MADLQRNWRENNLVAIYYRIAGAPQSRPWGGAMRPTPIRNHAFLGNVAITKFFPDIITNILREKNLTFAMSTSTYNLFLDILGSNNRIFILIGIYYRISPASF